MSQFCQRSESVTSALLSSFWGVSGGEGIAIGKHTQMQTFTQIHNPTLSAATRSTQCSLVWIPAFWSLEISRVSYILSPHCTALYLNELLGQRAPKLFLRDPPLCVFHRRSHGRSGSHPGAPLGPVTRWTVRVQSRSVTKRVAPAASWEELAVIHAECVSGDWVTLPRKGKAGSAHYTHCWNWRHLTYTRQVHSVCAGPVCMQAHGWASGYLCACVCLSAGLYLLWCVCVPF